VLKGSILLKKASAREEVLTNSKARKKRAAKLNDKVKTLKEQATENRSLSEYNFTCRFCGQQHTLFVYEWAYIRPLRAVQEDRCRLRLNQIFDK